MKLCAYQVETKYGTECLCSDSCEYEFKQVEPNRERREFSLCTLETHLSVIEFDDAPAMLQVMIRAAEDRGVKVMKPRGEE